MKHVTSEAFAILLNAVMCILLTSKFSEHSIGRMTTIECSLTWTGYGLLKDCERKDKNAADATFERIRSKDAQTADIIANS
jgi:hypothetical protein